MRRAPGASRVKKYPGNFGCNMPSEYSKYNYTGLGIGTVYTADEFWKLVDKGEIETKFERNIHK